jgi:hypothetical protein
MSSAAACAVVTFSLLSRNAVADEGDPSMANPKFEAGLFSHLVRLEVTSMVTN